MENYNGLLNKGHSMRHPFCGRTPLKTCTDLCSVKIGELGNRIHRFRFTLNEKAGDAILLLSRILSRLSKR